MIFVWMIVAGLFAEAGFDQSLERSECKKELAAAIEGLGSTSDWQGQVPAGPDGQTFRSPLKKFPEWVEVRFQNQGPPQWIHLKETETLVYRSNDGKCKFAPTSFKVSMPKPVQGTKFFTDQDWKKLLSTKKKGLVYVWSPGMVYSVQFYGQFQKVAKELGLKFTAIVDPRAPKKFVDQVQARYRSGFENVRLASLDLQMRDVANHFPTAVIYGDGKVSRTIVIGVMSELELRARIQQSLDELSKSVKE